MAEVPLGERAVAASADGGASGADAGAAAVATGARPPGAPRRVQLGSAFFVLPAVVWLGAFFLVPLFAILIVSLGTNDATGHIDLSVLNLQNYVQAVRPEYVPAFVNSLRYALLTTVLSILIGYPIAYWISRYGGRRKVLLLILVMLPFWTSYLIRTYAWMIILRDNGVLNSMLQAVGLTSEPIPMLNTDFSVVLGMTYGFLPFAILPLYVSIDRLDGNLVQAARDLYASGRSAFLHVTLPLTMPGIIAAALLTFIPAIGDYVTPDLLGGAQTTTIAKVVQVIFTSGRDWPYGSALGFLLMIVTLGGTLLALRSLRQEAFAA
jgi:spermidine/putrescine transport system permease protein